MWGVIWLRGAIKPALLSISCHAPEPRDDIGGRKSATTPTRSIFLSTYLPTSDRGVQPLRTGRSGIAFFELSVCDLDKLHVCLCLM